MAKQYHIDQHPQQKEIIARLEAGDPVKQVADQFGIPYSNLWRYKQKLEERKVQVLSSSDEVDVELDETELTGIDPIRYLVGIKRDLQTIKDNYMDSDPRIGLLALDREIKLCEVYVKVFSEKRAWDERRESLEHHPEYLAIKRGLQEFCKAHPDHVNDITRILDNAVA